MLVEAKSNLAKLMASENLFVEQKNVETAYFDLKSRVLTIPMLNGKLSPELYDLLLGHEVGHALETPAKGWHDSIIDLGVNKSILNVCEDARIEKKIKRKFPGIRISFSKGYKELLEMDFFGVNGKDLNKFNFIDRVNLHTKGGASLGIKFTDEEEVLLREVETTETFEEAVEVAKKIQELMKADMDKKKQSEEEQKKKLTLVVERGGKSKDGEKQKINLDDYDEVEIIEVDASKADESSEEEEDESPEVTSSGEDEYTECETDKSFRKQERKLFTEEVGKEMSYTNIPELLLDNIIIPYKKLYSEINRHNSTSVYSNNSRMNMTVMKNNYNKFKVESSKVVSYLVKEFELRKNADQQARAQISKTGDLNMSKLHDYKFTDDIFKRMTKVPNGKSHGLVMYIDWSGSMGDYINSTVKQLLNLTMFCRKVNIPFEVYAFSTHGKMVCDLAGQWRHKKPFDVQEPKIGDVVLNPFSLLNLLSSKMNTKEFTEAASFLLDFGTGSSVSHYCTNYSPPDFFCLSGTPLNEAVISAFDMVPKFKENYKLEIVNVVFLTDGEGHTLSRKYEQQTYEGNYQERNTVTPHVKSRAFFRDTKTRATCEMDPSIGRHSFGAMQTVPLLNLLKQRLDCNVIGFYVCNARDARTAINIYVRSLSKIEDLLQEFRKNGNVMVKGGGYDEYYFLRSSDLDTDDAVFEMPATTTRSLVSSFSKYTGGKIKSRVVLNRFINLIT